MEEHEGEDEVNEHTSTLKNHWMRLKSLANKQVMVTQFVIGDPMNRVHMSKNKSLVSFDRIKLILNQLYLFLWGVWKC